MAHDDLDGYMTSVRTLNAVLSQAGTNAANARRQAQKDMDKAVGERDMRLRRFDKTAKGLEESYTALATSLSSGPTAIPGVSIPMRVRSVETSMRLEDLATRQRDLIGNITRNVVAFRRMSKIDAEQRRLAEARRAQEARAAAAALAARRAALAHKAEPVNRKTPVLPIAIVVLIVSALAVAAFLLI